MEETIITFLTLNFEKILPAFIDIIIIATEITVVFSVWALIDKIRGMDIIITTTAKTDEEAREFLALMGMPFANA